MADQQISAVKDQAELEHLELPKTDVRSLIRHFGPGMVSVSYTHLRAHET